MAKKNLRLVLDDKKSSVGNISIDDLIRIEAKTENQGQFMSQYDHKPAFLLHGCAGTGKTFIALYRALEEVMEGDTKRDQVVIVRSAVPSREIGHLPGDQDEKTEVYSAPYQSICQELFPGKFMAYKRLVEGQYVEFMSTSFVRGITLDNSVIIVDECQNLNDMEINSIMTRVGSNTKIIFCGDFRQTDLNKRNDMSGMKKFMATVDNMPSFCSIEFGTEDIVRSKLVREYIEARMKYEDEYPLSA
jgi:phosphate starvation-inducible PhoH-like protein